MDSIVNTVQEKRLNILGFIKRHYPLISAVSLSALVIVLVIFSITAQFPNKKTLQDMPTSSPTIAPTIIPKPNKDIYEERTAKEEGFINFSENSELATESKKNILADGSIRYTVGSKNPNRSDVVIVKNGIFVFARHAVIGNDVREGYKSLLGKRDTIFSIPTFYGPDTVIYFYSEGGTALTVNPTTNTVYEEFTFQPPISAKQFDLSYKEYAR